MAINSCSGALQKQEKRDTHSLSWDVYGCPVFLFEPQSTQRAQRKRKALPGALRVLCGSNSILSTCINPDVYGAFKLKSVPLI